MNNVSILPVDNVARYSQYMTPAWAAEALVGKYFPNLDAQDCVLEPSCGAGAFLQAIPEHVPAVGVEIDPDLAAIAVRATGRRVIVGDFRMVDINFQPTVMLGNPPFAKKTIMEFIDRAWSLLPDEGRVGLILPVFALQTASTIDTLAERWSMEQSLIPRNLYPRLQHPLCFAQLTKGPRRGLVGFALYHELHAVTRLQKRYQELLNRGEGSVWVAVVRAGMEALGSRATLAQLYAEIQNHRPTQNVFWKEKVRQTVQRIAVRVGDGEWELPQTLQVAA